MLLKLLFLSFISFSFLARSSAQDSILMSLKEYSSEFDERFTSQDHESVLANSKVIALGEASHGTKEFFDVKGKIVYDLVKKHEITSIIFESDYLGTTKMDSFINGGKISYKDALIGMGSGIFFTEEFKKFMLGLKQYNSTLKKENKIKLYGCETNYPIDFSRINPLERSNDSLFIADYKNSYELLKSFLSKPIYEEYSRSEKNKILNSHEELSKYAEEVRSRNAKLYEELIIYNRVFYQNIKYRFTNGKYKQAVLRNKFMAENIILINSSVKKSIVWAHNNHISKTNNNTKIKPFGVILEKYYGSNYFAIGFDFYEGVVRGYDRDNRKYVEYFKDSKVKRSTYNTVLAQLEYEISLIDFRRMRHKKKTPAYKYFNKKMLSHSFGFYLEKDGSTYQNYKKYRIIEAYDYFVFFKKTNASVGVKLGKR